MTNCKQIPIPKLEGVDVERLIFFYKLGNHLFSGRFGLNHWQSFDLVDNKKISPMMKHFPSIASWLDLCKKHTGITTINNLYVSILSPRQQIPWHTDMSTDVFCKSFITAIKTDKSFIEFKDDKRYEYTDGLSYVIRSANEHRIFNMNDDYRITLCVTPEENPYV